MKKVLFISSFIGVKHSGGSVAAHSNLALCKKLFPQKQTDAYGFLFSESPVDNNITYLPSYRSKLQTFLSYTGGYAGGLTKENFNTLKKIIDSGQYDIIFLDGSLLGKLAKYARKKNPRILVIVFFHNLEKDFFKEMYKGRPAYIPVKRSAIKNERLAALYAGLIICFNERDAALIKKTYGREVSGIFPITVEDKLNGQVVPSPSKKNTSSQLLFVGSNFSANVKGIKWFSEHVMPHTNATLTVFGKNMENYKESLQEKNIHVPGTVENIYEQYKNADAVVAPIFSGSGMKVKMAEALMMGKTILGTTEAWEGYGEAAKETGFICNTEKEFIDAIEHLKSRDTKFNRAAREQYEQYYSPAAQAQKIQSLTERINEAWKQLN